MGRKKLLLAGKEKKSAAEARVVELKTGLSDNAFEVVSKQSELDVENLIADGSDELKKELTLQESEISDSR